MLQQAKGKWGNSLVLYTIGPRPYYIHLKAYIKRIWKPVGGVELFARRNGFFLVKFDRVDDLERIRNGGPYFFDSRLILLKKWHPGINYSRDVFSSLPIWVRFDIAERNCGRMTLFVPLLVSLEPRWVLINLLGFLLRLVLPSPFRKLLMLIFVTGGHWPFRLSMHINHRAVVFATCLVTYNTNAE